jgi:hypothetical protein
VQLPKPRGPLSSSVFAALREPCRSDCRIAVPMMVSSEPPSPLTDEDRQITLWSLYELHYAGFDDVADDWEWNGASLTVRRMLEADLERWLREMTWSSVRSVCDGSGGVAERLFDLVKRARGPSLSRFVRNHASRQQVIELLIHRSIYNLKEADPHTWAIPRLQGSTKVALVELQYDEYGAGRPERQHARMFADTMTGCGLDDSYGAYIDDAPASTLAVSNMMSLFGLHRRLRGACMGHLAAFEATSSLPAREISAGLTRLRMSAAASYFDEHIEADAVHEQLAARNICGALVAEDPDILEQIAFGAASCLLLDQHAAEQMLRSWQGGRSALRGGSPAGSTGMVMQP